jgi:hypothetical protein
LIVQVRSKRNLFRVAASVARVSAVSIWAVGLGTGVWALAQNATPGASQVKLQPYTAPDQSASAGVPDGWKVTKGEQTVIVMTGPQDETIYLGNTAVVRNGPFQPGQRSSGGIDLSMPYSANLVQKFTMLLQNNAAVGGAPPPQLSITSATPLQVPAALGQCGRIVAGATSQKGPMKVAALMCCLPLDSGGTYKVIFKLAQAPAAIAAQESVVATAVFASYRVPPAMLQRKLAPNIPAPMVLASPGIVRAPGIGGGGIQIPGDTTNSDCFDLTVIRETPTYRLPKKCGGPGPD